MKIRISAEYITYLTRDVEVPDDFDASGLTKNDFEDLFIRDSKSYDPVTNEEQNKVIQDLSDADIWLVTDENNNELWHD